MSALKLITGHVIYSPAYTYKFQLKTNTVWEVTKREVWMDAKSRNDVSLDFPNLPYWIDGNVKLTQSSAILRHLARKNGLYGLTDANADEIGMYIFF